MTEKLTREDVRDEAERIDLFDKRKDHKVKGVPDEVAIRYTQDAIRLADEIERAEIREEDKQLLLEDIRKELSGLKTKRSLKKRSKDFNEKLALWREEIKENTRIREQLITFIKGNIKYLPLAKSSANMEGLSVKELKNIKTEITENKKEFEKFERIKDVLPKEIKENFLQICFIKYLENGKSPEISTIISGLKEVRKKQEKILKKQKETAKLIQEIEGTETTTSYEDDELTVILIEILNTTDVQGSIQKLELDEAYEAEVRQYEKIKRIKEAMEVEQEMRNASKESIDTPEGRKDLLKKQLAFFNILIKNIKEDDKDAEEVFTKLVGDTDDEEAKKEYLAQLIAAQGESQEKTLMLQRQIKNTQFALDNFDAEKTYIQELINTNKELSDASKEFMEKKRIFLGEKIKEIKEKEDEIHDEYEELTKKLKDLKLEEKHKKLVEKYGDLERAFKEKRLTPQEEEDYKTYTELYERGNELIKQELRLEAEKKYLELEEKAASNIFDPKEWISFYTKYKRKHPDLAKKVRLGISLYSPRYLKNFDPIKKVNDQLLPLHDNLGRIYGVLSGVKDRSLSQDILDDWNSTLGEAKDEFLEKKMYVDVQRGLTELKLLEAHLRKAGLNELDPIIGTLSQMTKNYESLHSMYGHKECEFLTIVENISELEADTTTNHLTHFLETEGIIIGGAIVGATLFAIPGGKVAGAMQLGAVSEFILVSACAGVGMTIGTEVAKPIIGLVPDFSLENMAHSSARNTLMSMAFMGAGKIVGGELKAVLRAGEGGGVARGMAWVKGGIDKAWERVSGMGAGSPGAVTRYLTGNMFKEGSEEFVENWSEKTHWLLGMMASTFNAMDGINVDVKTAIHPGLKLITKKAELSIQAIRGNEVVFEYNPANQKYLTDKISQNGGHVFLKGDEIICEFKQGTETVTYRFLPSNAPIGTRQFLATDTGKALEKAYNFKFDGKNYHTYEGDGVILQSQLEEAGFLCVTHKGRILAMRKGEKIVLKPSLSTSSATTKPRAKIVAPILSRAHRANEAYLAGMVQAVPGLKMQKAREKAGEVMQDLKNRFRAAGYAFNESVTAGGLNEGLGVPGQAVYNGLLGFIGLRGEPKKKARPETWEHKELRAKGLEESTVQDMQELFPEGVTNSHFEQGNTGSCYLLSSWHALKTNRFGRLLVASMFSKVGKDQWQVRFRGSKGYQKVKVSAQEAREGQNIKGILAYYEHLPVDGQPGDQVMERAYGRGRVILEGNQRPGKHSMIRVESGRPIEALDVLLGDFILKKYDIHPEGTGPSDGLNKDRDFSYKKQKTEYVLSQAANNPDAYLLVAATPAYGRYGKAMDPGHRFSSSHAYTITDIDPARRTLTVVNPHGTKVKRHKITYDEFFEYFRGFEGVKVDVAKMETALEPMTYGPLNEPLVSNIPKKYAMAPGQPVRMSIGGTHLTCFEVSNGDVFVSVGNSGKGYYVKPGGDGMVIGAKEIEAVTGTKNPKISTKQFKIKNIGNGEIIVIDLQSTNGTMVTESARGQQPARPERTAPGVEQVELVGQRLQTNEKYFYSAERPRDIYIGDPSSNVKMSVHGFEDGSIYIDLEPLLGYEYGYTLQPGHARHISRDFILQDTGLEFPTMSGYKTPIQIKAIGDGKFRVTDKGSTNGTIVF